MESKKKRATDYSKEEIELIQQSPLLSNEDLAFRLDRSVESVRKKRWTLDHPERAYMARKRYHEKGCSPDDNKLSGCAWSRQEKELLLTSTKTDYELSQELKRSVNAIQSMRARLKRQKKKK